MSEKLTTWDELLDKSGKTYDEAIEILISYKLIKKSDYDWSMNAHKWGYIVWSESHNDYVITEEGVRYMLECCEHGVDQTTKVFSRRGSKYGNARKLLEKYKLEQELLKKKAEEEDNNGNN